MEPDFSEFTYGFAFTQEYINRNPGLVKAPELPSLIDEAEKGYDLKLDYLGHAKFFQFKLSTYMNRRGTLHWDCYKEPHFRVLISTHSRMYRPSRHTILKRLSERQKNVLYVAPRFHTQDQFHRFYRDEEITTNSLWAPLRCLPYEPLNEKHYLTFTANQSIPDWKSEPMKLSGEFTAEEHYAMTDDDAGPRHQRVQTESIECLPSRGVVSERGIAFEAPASVCAREPAGRQWKAVDDMKRSVERSLREYALPYQFLHGAQVG